MRIAYREGEILSTSRPLGLISAFLLAVYWLLPTTVSAGAVEGLAPTVSAVSPAFGLTAGGTIVTITGTHFGAARHVRFGSAEAAFRVISDTSIVATAPPEHLTGSQDEGAGRNGPLVDIRVQGAGGQSGITPADQFRYLAQLPQPGITGMTPQFGPTDGSGHVTLTGRGFVNLASVRFSDGINSAAASWNIISDSILDVQPGPLPVGAYTVYVATALGVLSSGSLQYHTFQRPVVSSVSPNEGPTTGGTAVTVTGSSLTGLQQVEFCSVYTTSFVVESDTRIVVTSPQHFAQDCPVRAWIGAVQSYDSPAAVFTFRPTVTGITPAVASTGGTYVTVTGIGLANVGYIEFVSATGVRYDVAPYSASDSQLLLTGLVAPAGTYLVLPVVAGSPGFSSVTLTLVPPPTVTSITPTTGSHLGGTVVTIRGTAFTGAVAVTFGNNFASFTVDSDSQITAIAPPGDGSPQVLVTAPGGTAPSGPHFTYV